MAVVAVVRLVPGVGGSVPPPRLLGVGGALMAGSQQIRLLVVRYYSMPRFPDKPISGAMFTHTL